MPDTHAEWRSDLAAARLEAVRDALSGYEQQDEAYTCPDCCRRDGRETPMLWDPRDLTWVCPLCDLDLGPSPWGR